MLDIIPTIGAVLLIVAFGYLIKRKQFFHESLWGSLARLCYWVLFPGLLFNLTSRAVLAGDLLGPFLIALSCGGLVVVLFAYLTGRMLGANGPAMSSLIQGGLRHNGFLALSILQGAAGLTALEIGAIGVAFLVPISNIVAVVVLFVFSAEPTPQNIGRAVARELLRNPLIGAVILGVVVNIFNVQVPGFLSIAADMLGAAALPLLLLSIGASLQFASIRSNSSLLIVAVIAKIVVFPGVLVGLGYLFGLSTVACIVLAAIGAAPTATSSYALAKELGGDAELMAEIISVQTLVAAVTMPVWLLVAASL